MAMDLVEYCFEMQWSDGLPVVPPTRHRVEEMLGSLLDSKDYVVATMQPSGARATRELIAANAVMAGCASAYFPVVEAAIEAISDPGFNLDRVATTASSQVPIFVVNGPLASEVGLEGAWEVLSGSSRSSATIGRAAMLCLRNIASHTSGGMPHSTIGSPMSRGLCFTENIIDSPWGSWHISEGFDAEESWVSAFAADPPVVLTEMGDTRPESIIETVAEGIALAGTYNAFFRSELWLFLSPQHASVFDEAGWNRDDVVSALVESSARNPQDLVGRGLYGYVDQLRPPVWLEQSARVTMVDRHDRVKIFVAGGQFGGYTAVFFGQGETITKRVRRVQPNGS